VQRGGGDARPVLSTPLVPLLHSTSRHHPLSLFISFFTLFSFFPWLLSGSAPPFTNNAGFREVDEETKLKELNNGRLAMIAILELLRHDAQQLVGGMYQEEGVFKNLITGYVFFQRAPLDGIVDS